MKKVLSNSGILLILKLIGDESIDYVDFSDILIRISESERLSLQSKNCESLLETEIFFVEVEFDFGSNKSILNGVKSGIEVVNNIIPIIKTTDGDEVIIAPLSDLLLMNTFLPENINLTSLKYDLYLKESKHKKDTFKDMQIMKESNVENFESMVTEMLNKS